MKYLDQTGRPVSIEEALKQAIEEAHKQAIANVAHSGTIQSQKNVKRLKNKKIIPQ